MWQQRLSEIAFDGSERSEILEAIESGWITAGPRTAEFERQFALTIGTTEAVAVSNGTAALWLALKAAGIGPGDEVLCPSLTFVATAAAVVHCGATPVLVDIVSLRDPTIDCRDAARKISRKTKAIIPVHYAGIPCDMDQVERLAARHNLTIIEDAAHAPGASVQGRMCGAFGLGCFSFFGNKNITTAEGGMITTSNRELAARMRRLRSHGMTVNSWDRDQGRSSEYDVLEFGFNFRLDDLRAAVGLAQLSRLDQLNRKRQTLAEQYVDRLSALKMDIVLPLQHVPADKQHVAHIFPVVFGDPDERRVVEHALRADGIQTSRHYPPIHRFTAFRELMAPTSLPVTEAFADGELTLPLHPAMSGSDIQAVVSGVARFAAKAMTAR